MESNLSSLIYHIPILNSNRATGTAVMVIPFWHLWRGGTACLMVHGAVERKKKVTEWGFWFFLKRVFNTLCLSLPCYRAPPAWKEWGNGACWLHFQSVAWQSQLCPELRHPASPAPGNQPRTYIHTVISHPIHKNCIMYFLSCKQLWASWAIIVIIIRAVLALSSNSTTVKLRVETKFF